jgi:DNA repair protein RadD
MLKLRTYQQKALDSIWAYYKADKKGNPLVVAPTGSGKSIIIAGFCEAVRKNWGDQHILILSHVKEILTQNLATIQNLLPEENIGIYAAGLKRKETKPITLASIQSAYNNMELFKKNFDIILVDEAHLIPHKGTGRYRTMIKALNKPVIGFTATPFRLGTGYLHIGKGALFDEIVYNITIEYLIEHKYLCPLAAKMTHEKLDPTDIKKTGGDYVLRDLAEKFDRNIVTEKIIAELLLYKDLRKKWLIFCIDISHAEHVTQMLLEEGIRAKCVHSKMTANRTKILEEYKTDPSFQALVSVAVLTTGFDAPSVDMVALLRPTASPVLHIQTIGRGLRIAPGKKDCLVLDFAGNLFRNGPINNPDIRVAKTGGEPIMKMCPDCFEILAAAVKICTACGYEFVFEHHLSSTSGDANILQMSEWHDVDYVMYNEHVTRAGKRMLKVTYECGLRNFSEYIGVQHDGYPRYKAEHWWKRRHSKMALPDYVEDALEHVHELKQPQRIFVNEEGKYPSIKEMEF